ncbi:chalcone isomerase family protein [Marinicellulosiphila megalodicopiae]|uniref:chalcone isomerase family protein n=1 Tax=Marinicellulosiphila megalodicopiae TaxID=2724896 RepID=UPI003BAFDA72
MKKLIFTLLFLMSTTAFSAPLSEDKYKVGEARFKYLFWKVYDSSLFTKNKKFESLNQELTLSITYLRNIPKHRIVDATVNQWEHLNFDQKSISKWREKIETILPEINKNDNLSFHKQQTGIGSFYYNGKLIGEINDTQFSDAFLSIWLSSNTSEPKLRQKLISQK